MADISYRYVVGNSTSAALALPTPTTDGVSAGMVRVIDSVTAFFTNSATAQTLAVTITNDTTGQILLYLGKDFGSSESDTLTRDFAAGLELWNDAAVTGGRRWNSTALPNNTHSIGIVGTTPTVYSCLVIYHWRDHLVPGL